MVPWTAHPEVWLLVIGAVGIGGYAAKVLQPKAVAAGYPPITTPQKIWFLVGIAGIWVASDWPVHDVAEDHLYSVHMLQHLALSMMLPAAFVLATPRWVIELLAPPDSRARELLRKASRPLIAGLTFNALTALLHWSQIVQLSADSAALHFLFHLAIFTSGLLMWMPVLGPITEWRLQPIAQCFYLFAMSIVPTVPGGWLVFAEGVVYRHYDTVDRLWGIDVMSDQQAAGAIMKLFGGFFLWGVIMLIFARWAIAEAEQDRRARVARHQRGPEDLTYEQVSEAFASSTPPAEP